jgi:rare lipoprotein A
MKLRLGVLAGVGLLFAGGASAADMAPPAVDRTAHRQYSAIGIASWYGGEVGGHATADGEKFDARSLSAAHRTLPLPCYARVTNLGNGRSIIVRVNDRGPFVGNRILDVSSRVAKLLEFNRRGVAKIKLEFVGMAPPAGSDETALLGTLRPGRAPASAEPTPRAGGSGETAVARVVEAPKPAEPRSPYGELVTYPFLVRTAGP